MMMNHLCDMTLKQPLTGVITRKIISTLLVLGLIFLAHNTEHACAAQIGQLEYDNISFDYKKVNKSELLQEADFYYHKFETANNSVEKKHYLQLAMGEYYTLTMLPTADIKSFVRLARLYDLADKGSLARSYFDKAMNINKNNADLNFYLGEFYYKRHEFHHALHHYKIAYNSEYSKQYNINLKMAIIYEKLADLVNAKKYYQISYMLNPQNRALQEKIHSINELNYEKTDYYNVTRE